MLMRSGRRQGEEGGRIKEAGSLGNLPPGECNPAGLGRVAIAGRHGLSGSPVASFCKGVVAAAQSHELIVFYLVIAALRPENWSLRRKAASLNCPSGLSVQ